MKHGPQFSESRYSDGNEYDEYVKDQLREFFDARNIIGVEPEEAYDNFQSEKELHQVLDYSGCDYVVDTFERAPFGVNHRTHEPTSSERRFDLRSDTGTAKPSEFTELCNSVDSFNIVPRYGTRLKKSESGIAWFRNVELRPLIVAIEDAGLEPHATWTDDSTGEKALFFDYDLLDSMGVVIHDVTD